MRVNARILTDESNDGVRGLSVVAFLHESKADGLACPPHEHSWDSIRDGRFTKAGKCLPIVDVMNNLRRPTRSTAKPAPMAMKKFQMFRIPF